MKLFRSVWKMIFFVLVLLSPVLCAHAAGTDEEAVREAVKRHFAILSGENLRELVEYEAIPKERILQTLAIKESGMQEYQNIETPYIDQLVTDKTVWVICINYEMVVEGLPPLPGCEALIVKKEGAGFRIVRDPDYMEELPKEVVDEVTQTATRKEVLKWYSQITSQYDELVEDHGEVIDWVDLCQKEGESKILEYQDWLLSDDKDFPIEKYLTGDTYTVQAGDCLWEIAGRYCGSEDRWAELYEQNKNVIGDDPSLIYPGQVLYIRTRKAK